MYLSALRVIFQYIVESPSNWPYETTAQAVAAGFEHHRAGRLDEADRIYRQVLVREPNNADALHLLGVTLGQRGAPHLAIDLISRAIRVRPDSALFHSRLAEFLRASRRYDECIAAFRRAIELAPNDADIHNNFGAALGDMRRFDAAIAELRRAIELRPDYAEARSNLGAALIARGNLDEAVEMIQSALKINPNMAGAYNNLGNALCYRGDVEKALEAFNKVVSYWPNDPKIHANLALAYLLLGDFPRGWREYEWRWQVTAIVGNRKFVQPRWDGKELNGKTIFLHPEQGFGDMIQFARFVPLVKSLGGRIILEATAPLFRLFKNFPDVDQLVMRDSVLPPFDVQCPLLSLGYMFRADAQTIPREIPYIRPDAQLAEKWGARFDPADGRYRVGIVWGGRPEHTNERNRSMKLEQLAPLARLQNIAIYNLQLGPHAAQLAAPPAGLQVIDWSSELSDFAETAALVHHLDLVLSVDTAVAHLAGAMGKRTWVMLPFVPDWRWMLKTETSPWYPNTRLFRQKSIGDWPGVLENVVASLQDAKR
jgi:tetratricopeptide (TPR) repeat protein